MSLKKLFCTMMTFEYSAHSAIICSKPGKMRWDLLPQKILVDSPHALYVFCAINILLLQAIALS